MSAETGPEPRWLRTPKSILVIVTQRIGDVLLTTPLIRSLRHAWPEARIDVLVFENTEGILNGNPDINRVLTAPVRRHFWNHLRFLVRLFRKYDLAMTTQTGDRPTLYAWVSGKQRVGLRTPRKKEQWKTRLLTRTIGFDHLNTHTVLINLAIADLLEIPRCPEVVVSWVAEDEKAIDATLPFDSRHQAFAFLHAYPKFNYKMWSQQGWIELAHWLRSQGLRTVLSCGNDPEELVYVRALAAEFPIDTVNLDGKYGLGQVACLLKRAKLYVGPDTVVTHMAAALGTPTIGLFGPSNPVRWGPWPALYRDTRSPYSMHGSQQVGNVFLLQGAGECVPCMEEGCEHHIRSYSNCLQNLQSTTVIDAARHLLAKANLDT
ncbi:MAG: glycosyltransferase family 9 protein [Acidiferrobacterales bacterium]